MTQTLRLMTWNIGEGRSRDFDKVTYPDSSQMPFIAERIRDVGPDVLLLNEVLNYNRFTSLPLVARVNQVTFVRDQTDLKHVESVAVNSLGLRAVKEVAVMSRWPIDGEMVLHMVSEGYGFLETSVQIGGVRHHLFSLRFDHASIEAQLAGLTQLREVVLSKPAHEAIVVAGDFNCGYGQAWFLDFANRSGLRNTRAERPPAQPCTHDEGIDHIFLRGEYDVVRTAVPCPSPHPSDHPWVVAELKGRQPDNPPALTTVPAVQFQSKAAAGKLIASARLTAQLNSVPGWLESLFMVVGQQPGPHARVPVGSTVICTLGFRFR